MAGCGTKDNSLNKSAMAMHVSYDSATRRRPRSFYISYRLAALDGISTAIILIYDQSKSRTLAIGVSQDNIPSMKNTRYPPKNRKDDIEDKVGVTSSPREYRKWWQNEC
jgi:hypothetical protein